MSIRPALTIILLAVLLSCASAQEPSLMSMIWNNSVKGAVGKTTLLNFYVSDIDNDGASESVVITSGIGGTAETKDRNRIIAFKGDGKVYWDNKIDDVVKAEIMHDINNDNKQEFILTSGQALGGIQRGTIRIIGSDGQLMRDYDSTTIIRSMYLTDMKNDGYYQILTGATLKVILFQIYGERLWMYPSEGGGTMPLPVDAVAAGDVDGDNKIEMIVGSDRIYFLNQDGGLIKAYDVEPDETLHKKGFKYLKVMTLSGGGYQGIVAVTKNDDIHAFKITKVNIASTQKTYDEIVESWTLSLGTKINTITTYDMNGDGFQELIVGCPNGRVYSIDKGGHILWEYPANGDIGDIAIGDMDEDNVSDIIVGTYAGSIYTIDHTGHFKWKYDTVSPILRIGVGDVKGDNNMAIVVVKENNVIEAYEMNKTYVLRKRADNYFAVGQEYYITAPSTDELSKAREYFVKARQIYTDLGYEKGVSDCETLIKRVDEKLTENKRKDADLYYGKAQEYFVQGEYDSADSFVKKAKNIYLEFGDSEMVLKCELMELRIKNMRTPVVTPTMPTIPVSPSTTLASGGFKIDTTMVSIAGLLILAVIIISYIRRKRAREQELLGESDEKTADDLEALVGNKR